MSRIAATNPEAHIQLSMLPSRIATNASNARPTTEGKILLKCCTDHSLPEVPRDVETSLADSSTMKAGKNERAMNRGTLAKQNCFVQTLGKRYPAVIPCTPLLYETGR